MILSSALFGQSFGSPRGILSNKNFLELLNVDYLVILFLIKYLGQISGMKLRNRESDTLGCLTLVQSATFSNFSFFTDLVAKE
jgi:hypothetical protein